MIGICTLLYINMIIGATTLCHQCIGSIYNAPGDARAAIKECTAEVPQMMKKHRCVKKDKVGADGSSTYDEAEKSIGDPTLLSEFK